MTYGTWLAMLLGVGAGCGSGRGDGDADTDTDTDSDADTDAVGALLSGTAGITTMPSAAVPANGVNLFEMVRDIWGSLVGTAVPGR